MAIVTGTSSSYSVGTGGGNREDLEDIIHDLFPEDTVMLTNLDKVSASSTFHEWLGDQPAAAASNITLNLWGLLRETVVEKLCELLGHPTWTISSQAA